MKNVKNDVISVVTYAVSLFLDQPRRLLVKMLVTLLVSASRFDSFFCGGTAASAATSATITLSRVFFALFPGMSEVFCQISP